MALQSRNLEALSLFSILTPTTVSDPTNTTGVDLSIIDGDAAFVLTAAASASSTGMKVKVQHSATQNGTYADVDNGSFTDLGSTASTQQLTIPRSGLNGWFRLAFHTETGTFSAPVSCIVVGMQRYMS